MKKIAIVLLALFASSAQALEIYDNSYQVEVIATYSNAAASNNMCTDADGNLYILHYDNGNVMKVSSDGSSSLFASANHPADIAWGGGTAFGDSLYITNRVSTSSGSISKINSSGQISTFAGIANATFLAIDSSGNYGNNMFTGTSDIDQLYQTTSNGDLSLFTSWPGWTNGGGPYGGNFDSTGKFGGNLYVASSFSSTSNQAKSGIFSIDTNGIATKFNNDILEAFDVEFDEAGKFYDGDMLVKGKEAYGGEIFIFKLDEMGNATKLFGEMRGYTFGIDGALYINEYDWNEDTTTIYRVVPEPATMILLALGGIGVARRRS